MFSWVTGVQLLLALLCLLEGNAVPGAEAVPSPGIAVLDQATMCQELMNHNASLLSVPWDCLCYTCKGTQGISGPKGDRGPQGTPGSPGLRGAKGSEGARGLQGLQGPRGLKGSIGDKGDQGLVGRVGMKGDPGDKGDKGDSGNDGVPGTPGPPGLQGVCPPCKGEKGLGGDVGPQGTPGLKGDIGLPGKNGLNGTKGDKGDVGPQGITGAPGSKGDLGPQGLCNCRDGTPGATGAPGPQGPQGIQGALGPKGNAGAKGDQGLQGEKGNQGDQGYQGMPGPCSPHMQSSFSALLTVSYPKSSLPVPFNKVIYNPQNHFNPTTSIYIAPTNGTYLFTYQLSVYGRVLVVGLFRNSKVVARLADDANRGVSMQTLVLHLDAGDNVWLQTKNDQSNGIYFDGNTDSTFSGHLMYPDVCDGMGSRSSPFIPTQHNNYNVGDSFAGETFTAPPPA